MEAKNKNIPYIVYEAMLEKEDRQQRRMVVIIILLITLLVASNTFWVYEWNQYDYVDEEMTDIDVKADDGGTANYIGRNGDITNGENKSDNPEETDSSEAKRLEGNTTKEKVT